MAGEIQETNEKAPTARLALASGERRALRARAHSLRPVVIIGDAGLTPTVLAEIDRNLTSHELIKVRASSDSRQTRDSLLQSICEQLQAAPVQHLGKILVVYRPLPPQPPKPAQPPRSRRNPPRRTKRSYQR
jgi:RNA-binding protein